MVFFFNKTQQCCAVYDRKVQILTQKPRERANLKLCLQQRTQEYVWISYSNGLNFALLLFFPSFPQLTGFIHRGRSLDANSHISAKHWFGAGSHWLFQESSLPGLAAQDPAGVEPEPCQDAVLTDGQHAQHCTSHPDPRACSEPHPYLSTQEGWNLYIYSVLFIFVSE